MSRIDEIVPGFQSPEMIEMLQSRLGALNGMPSDYIGSLPTEVKARIKALANIHDKSGELEVEFQNEMLILKKKYHALNTAFYTQRDAIISGTYEPTEAECTREDSDEEDSEDEEEEEAKAEVDPNHVPVKGIPEFWSTVLKNHPQIGESITEKDAEILSHLTNISFSYLDAQNDHGFTLTFTFSENKFFTNAALVKTYNLLNSADAHGDIMFDKAQGTVIDWHKGMDVTTTIESKKQRHKGTNKTRIVKKVVKCPSFFNFFSPPQIDEDNEDEEENEAIEEQIELDYELGETIKEKLIVNACDWFTGKALQYEGEDFGDDYSGEESEGEGESGEEDDEEQGGEPAVKPECKQQ